MSKSNWIENILFLCLICQSQMNGKCKDDNDCFTNTKCFNQRCHRLPFNISIKTVIGFSLLFIALSCNSALGLTGSSITLPIFIFLFDYYHFEAIPLLSFTHFIASIISIYLNHNILHPYRNCLAVDYNITLIPLAYYIAGVMIGHGLTVVISWFMFAFFEWTMLICSSYLLITQYKGLLHSSSSSSSSYNDDFKEPDPIQSNQQAIRIGTDRELMKEKSLFQLEKLKPIIITISVMLLLEIIRESNVIMRYSLIYWLLFFSFILYSIISTEIANRTIQKEFQMKIINNYPYNEKDIRWTTKTIYACALIGMFSGVINASCGIDQGLLLPPYLYYIQLNPKIIFPSLCLYETISSFCSFVYFLAIDGRSVYSAQIVITLGIIASFASVCGYFIRKSIIKRYKNEELIITGGYTIIITISTCVLSVYLLYHAINETVHKRDLLFN